MRKPVDRPFHVTLTLILEMLAFAILLLTLLFIA